MLSSECLRIWFTVDAIPLLKSLNSLAGLRREWDILNAPIAIKEHITISHYLLKNLTVKTTAQAEIEAGIKTKTVVVKKLPR